MRDTVKANAQAFAVRRVGEQHDWCVSQAEIGRLTGMTVYMVNKIMWERGYRIDADYLARNQAKNARKSAFDRGGDADINEMELTDIFS